MNNMFNVVARNGPWIGPSRSAC